VEPCAAVEVSQTEEATSFITPVDDMLGPAIVAKTPTAAVEELVVGVTGTVDLEVPVGMGRAASGVNPPMPAALSSDEAPGRNWAYEVPIGRGNAAKAPPAGRGWICMPPG